MPDRLRTLLATRGALSPHALAGLIDGGGRHPIGSAVDRDPGLAWFAPGLVARTVDLPALGRAPPAAFLCNTQVRRLAEARRAGESDDSLYAGWSASAERALLEWAYAHPRHAPDRESLLAVSDPAGWNVGDDECERWCRRRWLASYTLERTPECRAEQRRIVPDSLFRVLTDLLGRDRTSWLRINRLARVRIDAGGAIETLALLVSLGVLEAGESWQRSHPVRHETLSDLWPVLARHRARTGSLDDDASPMHELLSGACPVAARPSRPTSPAGA